MSSPARREHWPALTGGVAKPDLFGPTDGPDRLDQCAQPGGVTARTSAITMTILLQPGDTPAPLRPHQA